MISGAAVWGQGWTLLAESTESWSHRDDTVTIPLRDEQSMRVATEGFSDRGMFATVHVDGEPNRRTGFVNEVRVLKTDEGVKLLTLHYIRDTSPVREWSAA